MLVERGLRAAEVVVLGRDDFHDKRPVVWPKTTRTVHVARVERECALPGESLGDVLFRKYWIEENSIGEAAVALGVSGRWFSARMDELGITRRSRQEAASNSWREERWGKRKVLLWSPQARENRIAGIRRYWAAHPAETRRVAAIARAARGKK